MRNHWLGFKTVLHESVEWLMWKVWRRSVFRCFRRAFVFLFGRTGRATLIPAPVSKCPFSRTWLDKFPLKSPNGPHGLTLSNPEVAGVNQDIATKFAFALFCAVILIRFTTFNTSCICRSLFVCFACSLCPLWSLWSLCRLYCTKMYKREWYQYLIITVWSYYHELF